MLRDLAYQAQTAGVLTAVGLNFRFAGPYLRIKELLAQEDVGDLVSISIRHLASKPRSPLWGMTLLESFLLAQAIHPLDLLMDLGGLVTDVRAVRRIEDGDITLAVQAEFLGGAVGSVITGNHAPACGAAPGGRTRGV